jgi:3-isopropylmalate/(R)-2-methylmalate dehydratase small subunit
LNNALLPIQISEKTLALLFQESLKNPELILEVDLENQYWSVPEWSLKESFEISAYKRTCLLNGYDDIDYVLSHKKDIIDFELKRVHEKKYFNYTR